MSDINFLFGALAWGLEVAWKPVSILGGFFVLVVALGYIWYRVERNINRKLTQPFREAMERKDIKVVDGRMVER